MTKLENFQENKGNGDSSQCKPSTKVNPEAVGKGVVNGLSSFLGWGDVFDSIGGEKQTNKLAEQVQKLQTITPQLLIRMAQEQTKISQDQLNAAINASKLAVLQTQYAEKVLQNGSGIDKLIIVMSMAALTLLVLVFTIIR
jgi:hypothetical protein